jgi:hypothetical protein
MVQSKWLFLCGFVFSLTILKVEAQDRYAVFYKYKPQESLSLENPQGFLTSKAIQRRNREGVQVDSLDLPVSQKYVDQVFDIAHYILYQRLETLVDLADSGKNLIYEVNVNELKHLEAQVADRLANLDIFMLIRGPHEKLTKEEEEIILKVSGQASVILGSGISEFNVKSLVAELKLYGIALEGGEEIKPGLKDFDELADILEELEVED